MIYFYWHCRQISPQCYEGGGGETCGLAQADSQSVPSREVTNPGSAVTSSWRMQCRGRPGSLLLPSALEMARSGPGQRRTWTAAEIGSWMWCLGSWFRVHRVE